MTDPITFARSHQNDFLEELKAFLRIPSVSTAPEFDEETAVAAEWLADSLRRAGLENVRVIATERHPLLYADWLHAGAEAPTVLIYGHYDVQPADPLEKWETPPFEPTIRDDYIYARGASDDKGQVFLHVKAVQALLQENGRLPVNVKFIIEGEEESGGASLSAFIPQNKKLLAADVALISDTSMVSKSQPSIVYGLRGMCYTFVDIQGPRRDLHSGSFGGAVDNPLNVMAHIIAKLKDENGKVQVPGFYDKVRPLTDRERDILAEYPFNEEAWLAETGVPQPWGEPGYSIVERLGARPTLDVHGIVGGYMGAGAKTVLPGHAHAKISMRLVPDQDPKEIAQLFKSYIEGIAPPTVTVTVTVRGGAPASISDLDMPAMQAAQEALAAAFNTAPVFMREGGSIPVVGEFQSILGLETILMGFGLADDQIHAPNERFYLPNFYRGIEASIYFLQALGRHQAD